MSVPGRLLTVDEAVAAILDRVRPLDPRLILLADALGLVLAEPIVADGDLPPFAKATMDGYAVRAADLAAGGEHRLRVVAEITAGQTSDRELVPGEAARIMTGAPLPPGADAVVHGRTDRPRFRRPRTWSSSKRMDRSRPACSASTAGQGDAARRRP